MSEAGIFTIGDLITRIRQESDMVNSQFVTDPEIVTYLSSSYKELYDLLITSYGEDYSVATPISMTTNGTDDRYPLPNGLLTFKDQQGNDIIASPFYKLLGVDYQLSPNNPSGYVTIKTFSFSERNRFAVPNFASFWGFTNVRYRLLGNQIWFTPLPVFGQVFRMWYIPRPTDLIFSVQGTTSIASTSLTVNDGSVPKVGMTLFSPNIPAGTTVVSITGTTVTMSAEALGPGVSTVQMFDYLTQLDGISGWEEYPVVDVAIKCKDKEESSVDVLAARKAGLRKRIEETAINRDPGQPARTADVMTDIWNTGTGSGWGDGYGAS